MTGMLEGIKVIEMGHAIAMPAAGAMMADWGAEVIKLEPLTGEFVRGVIEGMGNRGMPASAYGGLKGIFEVHNRNKKGMAIDLTKESARDILYELVKRADVFMSNYEVNALKKLKVDHASLSLLNPRLIYALVTGYGTVGPDKDERGFDFIAAWAHSGMQYMVGEPESPPPMQPRGIMDRTTAAYIVAGISTALFYREKTGEGQEVHCSLYHTGTWTLATDIQAALMAQPLPKHDRRKVVNVLMNTYQAGDGLWLLLSMPQADLFWPSVCRVIERPELESDPRFSNMEARGQNSEELIRILDEAFATRDREEWQKRLKDNNCIYGWPQTPTEVLTDPQALANNFFATIEHPAGGEMKLVTTPVDFIQNPASVRKAAPQIGEHTEEILLELGYGWDDIARLKDEGAIL